MRWFDKKVEVSVPDGRDGTRIIRVRQKQLDHWIAQGKLRKIEGVTVHILDIGPDRTEIWEIGKDVSREIYEEYKDENGHLYVSIHYEHGEPQVNVATKQAWDMIKAATDF
jgi:hypothetical protein